MTEQRAELTVYVLTETTVDWDGWATGSPTLIGITASKADADEFVQEQRMHLRRDAEPKVLGGVSHLRIEPGMTIPGAGHAYDAWAVG